MRVGNTTCGAPSRKVCNGSGVSNLDIVFVHDISFDNKLLPTPWQQQFEIALKGAGGGPGTARGRQVLANVTSMQARIPLEFWVELQRQKLIGQGAPTPA